MYLIFSSQFCKRANTYLLGNCSKLLYSNRTHLWDRRGVLKETTYLRTLFYCWIEGWLCNEDTSFDFKQEGGRHTPPTILWFGGPCSSVVVFTTYGKRANTYLLVTEFQRHTVSYGKSFFLLDLLPKCEARGP